MKQRSIEELVDESYLKIIDVELFAGISSYFAFFNRVVLLSAIVMDVAWFYNSIRKDEIIFLKNHNLDEHVFKLWKKSEKLSYRFALQTLIFCSEEVIDNGEIDFTSILITKKSSIFEEWSSLNQKRNTMSQRLFNIYIKDLDLEYLLLDLLENLPFLRKSSIDVEKEKIIFKTNIVKEMHIFPFVKKAKSGNILMLDKVIKNDQEYYVNYRDIDGMLFENEEISSDILNDYYYDKFEKFIDIHKSSDIGFDTSTFESYSKFKVTANLTKALIKINKNIDTTKGTTEFVEGFSKFINDKFSKALENFENINEFNINNASDYISLALLIGNTRELIKHYFYGYTGSFYQLSKVLCEITKIDYLEFEKEVDKHKKETCEFIKTHYRQHEDDENCKEHLDKETTKIEMDYIILLASEEYEIMSKSLEYPITIQQRKKQIDDIFNSELKYEDMANQTGICLESLFKFLIVFYSGVYEICEKGTNIEEEKIYGHMIEVMKIEHKKVKDGTLRVLCQKFQALVAKYTKSDNEIEHDKRKANKKNNKEDEREEILDKVKIRKNNFEKIFGKKNICDHTKFGELWEIIPETRNASVHNSSERISKEKFELYKKNVYEIIDMLDGDDGQFNFVYPKVIKLNNIIKSPEGYIEYDNVKEGIRDKSFKIVSNREYSLNQRYYALPNINRACKTLWVEPLLIGCSMFVETTK